jgi:YVTN family beta-propeller protein
MFLELLSDCSHVFVMFKEFAMSNVFLHRMVLAASAAAVLTSLSAHAGQVVYVPNTTSNTVSVVDVDSGTVTKTIEVKGLPFIAAPLADGSKVYIDNLGTSVSGVSVINTADDSVKTIKLKFPPFSIVLSPDQSKLYAVKASSGLTSGIDIIDTKTDTVIKSYIPGGNTILPIGLQISPDGKTLFLSYPGGTISAIEAATGKTLFKPTYFGGVLPAWLSLSRDGKLLYVLNFISGDTIVVDTASWKQVARFDNGGTNAQPAIAVENLEGTKLFVTNFGTQTVQVIDKATWKEVGLIKTQGRPLGVAIAADGSGYYSDWGLKSATAIKPPFTSALAWVYLFLAGKGSLDKLGNGQLVHFDTHNYQVIGNPIATGVTPNIIEVGPKP